MNSLYWIHHPEHNDIFTQGYVGVSNKVKRRFSEHKNLGANAHLKNAITKYGWDNLIKEIVLISSKAYCLMIETKLRAEDDIGWNLKSGGGMPPVNRWNLGKKMNPESIEKMRQKNTGNSYCLGYKHTEEAKRNMSAARMGKPSCMKGRIHSAETRKKMSLAKLGKESNTKGLKLSQDRVNRMKELAIKEAWTCPHCDMSGNGKGAGNRWHFNNCRRRV